MNLIIYRLLSRKVVSYLGYIIGMVDLVIMDLIFCMICLTDSLFLLAMCLCFVGSATLSRSFWRMWSMFFGTYEN